MLCGERIKQNDSLKMQIMNLVQASTKLTLIKLKSNQIILQVLLNRKLLGHTFSLYIIKQILIKLQDKETGLILKQKILLQVSMR